MTSVGLESLHVLYGYASWFFQMHRPPSTSRFVPVMNLASSLAIKTHALTTSSTSPIRPIGTFPMNFFLLSGVSSIPVNAEKSPVPVTSGQIEFTRI